MISITKSLGAVICTSLNEGIWDNIKGKGTSIIIGSNGRQAAQDIMTKYKTKKQQSLHIDDLNMPAEKKDLIKKHIEDLKKKQ